jgi:hypothetical protein
MLARAILDGDDRWRLFSSYELVWAGGKAGRMAAQTIYWSMQVRDRLQEKIARYRDKARREADARQDRWAADKAARLAAQAAQRADEEARQVVEAEARRLAAREAAQIAAERARQHQEQSRKEEQARQIVEAARRAEEEARRAAADIERAAAEKAVRDAAAALARQLEDHKALTATVTPAPAAAVSGAAETETAAVIAGREAPPADVATTPEAVESRPPDRAHAVPTLEETMSAPAPIAEMFSQRRKGTARKPRKKKDGAPAS